MRISRQEAVATCGAEIIAKLETQGVDFTNRLIDGNFVEFSATLEGEEDQVSMYVLVPEDEVSSVENLDEVDWDTHLADAEYEVA